MISIKAIGWYLAAILAIVIFFIDSCRKPCPECPELQQTDTTALFNYWTAHYRDTTYIPVHTKDTVHDTVTNTTEIPADIDSLAVAMAYYSRWVVVDTILNDTNGLVIIIDLLYMNRIYERTIQKEFYPSIITVKNTYFKKTPPVNKFYAGMGVGGWTENFGLSAKVMFINKKDNAFGLSYDPINKYAEVSVLFKIHF
jgi:hypothetical protein